MYFTLAVPEKVPALQFSNLCGVHALNNLLQWPCFTADKLAAVAAQLDAEYEEISSPRDEFGRLYDVAHTHEDSANMEHGGNFSVQERFTPLFKISIPSDTG